MKSRSGFVSNSSSSSFIIVGEKIRTDEVKKYDNVWFIGSSYGEGVDCFEIDETLANALSTIENEKFHAELYHAVATFSGEGGEYIKPDILQKMLDYEKTSYNDLEILSINKSYYNSYDNDGLDDFIKMYLSEDY